ncbi:MAG: energy-coupling factor transport system permease/ATP-binding protein [Pseudonocardiales bacterium]|nr:energy-coupling factor transport system permease/ATP-binding protein [Pseudonocardiales bacterium]
MITDTGSGVSDSGHSAGQDHRSALGAVEVCLAAAMADLAAVVCVVLRFVPLGGLSTVLAAFPFAVLGNRLRFRTCVAAGISGCVVGFLLAGPVVANTVFVAAALGSVVGIAHRRAWSLSRTVITGSVALGVPAASVAVAGMWLFASYRQLAFAQLVNSWRGVARIVEGVRLPLLPVLVHAGDISVAWIVACWWVWLPVVVVVGVAFLTGCARLLFGAPLRLVARLVPPGTQTLLCVDPPGTRIAPLPLRLTQVSVRYPGSTRPALSQLDFCLDRGEFVTVTGRNGAGKSTLGRLIAGGRLDSGCIVRPGGAGLGAPGGTAMVFQRPESQVLGVRVVDDLFWGMPPGGPLDVESLLGRVGLTGMACRETATLSGGELQRLAVASLLARDPAIVISDETTAMLDPDGRAVLLRLLRSLAHREGKAVVHITHQVAEIELGDRTVLLGEAAAERSGPVEPTPLAIGLVGQSAEVPHGAVDVRGLGFAHAMGTPWEHRVLRDVNVEIPAGGGLLVTGANGSGKSTLASVLAGLSAPTEGQVLLDGWPVRNGRAGALLALQHPRLQLLRGTVGEDVRDAAAVGRDAADEALASLGLSPRLYRDRGVEELSVGEQRRVALAGLLACRPHLLVLDEPLAGLDQLGRIALLRALKTARETGTTLVMTSHDTAGLDGLVDDAVMVEGGKLRHASRARLAVGAAAPPPAGPKPETSSAALPRRTRPSAAAVVRPRTLPWSSPAHRLWVGTKIAVLGSVTIVLGADPTWSTLLAATVSLGSWAMVARVPRSVVPRIPRWFVLAILVSVALVTIGGGAPYISILGLTVGMGGLIHWGLFSGITALSLIGALLFIWTTALTDIPPLLQRVADVGRKTRLPVLEWTATISLGLRLLPILQEECRTVLKMTAQRADVEPGLRGGRWRTRRDQIIRGIVLCCATAARRSAEMGEAITARGGLGNIAQADRRPGRRDALALLFTFAVLVAGILI